LILRWVLRPLMTMPLR